MRRSNWSVALVALLSLARSAEATIAFDSSAVTCQGSAVNTVSCSFPSSKPTAGAAVIVAVTANHSGGAPPTLPTPTDNQTGNTYSAIGSVKDCNNSTANGNCEVWFWSALNVNVSGTYTVTDNVGSSACAGSCEISIQLISFTGVATSSATDVNTSDAGSSTTRDGGSLTTTNANDVIFMTGADAVSDTSMTAGTCGSTFTIPTSFNIINNTNQNIFGQYLIVSSTLTCNPTFGGTHTTGVWAGVDVALKASGAAPACKPTLMLLGIGKC